jgi:hypothetical protein
MLRALLITFVLVALLAVSVFSGCGSSKKIDHSVVESAIEASIAKQKKIGAVAQCPADVEAKKDAVFSCVVTLTNGSVSRFVVTQTNDAGNLRFSSAR